MSDRLTELAKQIIPQRDKPSLSDRRESLERDRTRSVPTHISFKNGGRIFSTYLFSRKALRSAQEFHSLQPDPDSPRADKNDFVALGFQAHDSLDHARERRQERLVGRFMDDRRCP